MYKDRTGKTTRTNQYTVTERFRPFALPDSSGKVRAAANANEKKLFAFLFFNGKGLMNRFLIGLDD